MNAEEIYLKIKEEFEANLKCFYYIGRDRPWHYLFFRQYRWYRKLTKSLWCQFEIQEGYLIWKRMNRLLSNVQPNKIEDYRKNKDD